MNYPEMKKCNLLVLLSSVCLLFLGCHTIRPPSAADQWRLNGLPHSSQKVLLVLDEDYRNYISQDRGNAVADPQTYYVGEALTPLTEIFFKEAYAQVEVCRQKPAAEDTGTYDLVIYPQVQFFSNDLQDPITLKQTIQIGLSAVIYDNRMNRLGKASGSGQCDGSLGIAAVIWGSTKRAGQNVNLALQNALADLVRDCHTVLKKAPTQTQGPMEQKAESMKAALQAYAGEGKAP